MIRMDVSGGWPDPKRGDLIQTNLGDRRERTWFVLYARHMRSRDHPRRFAITMVRWWDIEPDMRQALWRSAERRGGQTVFRFRPYAKRKKMTFEELMQR